MIGAGASVGAALIGSGRTIERTYGDETLSEIAEYLRAGNRDPAARYSVIGKIFTALFGRKHLSLKCVRASIMCSGLTIFMVLAFFILLYPRDTIRMLEIGPYQGASVSAQIIGYLLLLALVTFGADYLSLLKSRWLLCLVARWWYRIPVPALYFIDLLLCAPISISAFAIYARLGGVPTWYDCFANVLVGFTDGVRILLGEQTWHSVDIMFPLVIFSTLMTSIWFTLGVLSVLLLRTLDWFEARFKEIASQFDLDEHPVQAALTAAAYLVWAGSSLAGAALVFYALV